MENIDKSGIWFAVVNVFAASSKAASLWKDAEALLKEKSISFHGTRTGKAGNAAELTSDACMAGYRKFIAVGGDGTVHDVLNGIAGFVEWNASMGRNVSFSDFTLAVIPLGSGNDWVKSTGVPKDMDAAVSALAEGVVRQQDVVRVSLLDPVCLPRQREMSVSYMVNVGGIGIDARVCGRVNARKKEGRRGRLLYVESLLHAIANRVPARAKVVCDGTEVFDGAYLSVAFGVGKYSGGGMRQTPAAVIDDGLLDMTLIPDLPLMRIAREVPRLFTGTFLMVPELVVSQSKVIEVFPYGQGDAEPVEVDGEVVGKAPVRLEVLDEKINIMTL